MKTLQADFRHATWLNPPKIHSISQEAVSIVTEPQTDFWQRSYYGFRNDNAPALLLKSSHNFSFSCRASFNYQAQFDQCGLIIYLDSENWFKASIEYEPEHSARLGSVVTNMGYSDWASTDIASSSRMHYRLSRRGPDFLIESSHHGSEFKQMRIFHLHALGETSPEMGQQNAPLLAKEPIQFGLYACSPSQSSFKAIFDSFKLEPCQWQAHPAP